MGRIPPNVLKYRKQKRQASRRAYLTNVFSVIKVPRTVGKSNVPESSRPMFDYRDRGGDYYNAFIDLIMPGRLPGTHFKVEAAISGKITPEMMDAAMNPKNPNKGRRYALDRAEQEKILASIDCEDEMYPITVFEGGITRTRISFVFNRRYTKCFFTETCYHPAGSYFSVSKQYGSRERALFDLEHKRIVWMETVSLSSLTPVPPETG